MKQTLILQEGMTTALKEIHSMSKLFGIIADSEASALEVARRSTQSVAVLVRGGDIQAIIMRPDAEGAQIAMIASWAKGRMFEENGARALDSMTALKPEVIRSEKKGDAYLRPIKTMPEVILKRRPTSIETQAASYAPVPQHRTFCVSFFKEDCLADIHPHKKPEELYIKALGESVKEMRRQSKLPGYTRVVAFCDEWSYERIMDIDEDIGVCLVRDEESYPFHQQFWRYLGAFLPAKEHVHFRGMDNMASESSLSAAERFEKSGMDIYAAPYTPFHKERSTAMRLIPMGIVSMRGSCSIGPRAKRWMMDSFENRGEPIGGTTLAAKFHSDEIWLTNSLEVAPSDLSIMFDMDSPMPPKWYKRVEAMTAESGRRCMITMSGKKLMQRNISI